MFNDNTGCWVFYGGDTKLESFFKLKIGVSKEIFEFWELVLWGGIKKCLRLTFNFFSIFFYKIRNVFGQKSISSNKVILDSSQVSHIEYDNSQNVGLEDYNNISGGIFPPFTTPSIKISLG